MSKKFILKTRKLETGKFIFCVKKFIFRDVKVHSENWKVCLKTGKLIFETGNFKKFIWKKMEIILRLES